MAVCSIRAFAPEDAQALWEAARESVGEVFPWLPRCHALYSMAAVLGDAYPAFETLVGRAGPGAAEWRRYTKNSPWVLEVSQGMRSLFYARPDSGHLKRLHDSIRKAKVYPEGRPVSVVVKRPSDLAKVEELIAVKLEATARPSQVGQMGHPDFRVAREACRGQLKRRSR